MKLAILVATTVAVWVAAALAAASWDGERHWWFSGVAMVLCLVPAIGTLVLATITEHRSPVEAIGAVLAAPLIRLILVTMGGFVLWRAVPLFREDATRFWAWVLGFYLVTLVAETAVLLSRVGRRPPAPTVSTGS